MSSIISQNINPESYKESIIKGSWGDCKYNFYIYKNICYKKFPNLISVSLFTINDIDEVYANQKNISLLEMVAEYEEKRNSYINGLNTIVKRSGDFNIRIFCDSTSIMHCERHLKNKNVEIIYYHFDQFYDKERRCHYGFFGTLMRYISLFNFSNFDNKWDTVAVIDLENNYFNARMIINKYIKEMKSDTPELLFWSRPCYYLSERIYAMNHDLKNFSIISSLILQRKSQDRNIFINFLNNCLLKHDKDYDDTLRKYLKIDFEKRAFNGRLEYGVDEYFINYHFLNICYINKNLPFYVIFYRDISCGFLEWIKNIRFCIPKKKITNEEVTRDFLEIILKEFFPEDIVIPGETIDEYINNLAETYYKMKLQYIHRTHDHTAKINYIYNELKNEKYKQLDIYDEYMKGLSYNNKIKNLFYTCFKISPDPVFPKYKDEIVWDVSRG